MINSAGNSALRHWASTFSDADDDDVHEFAAGDELMSFAVAAGDTFCGTLKWDAWPVTSDDFDLFLVAANGTVVASSVADQSRGPLPPMEELCWTNGGAAATFSLAITRYSAAASPRMDLFTIGTSPLEYIHDQGSITEPASSPYVLAVGARCMRDSPATPRASAATCRRP